MNAALTRVLRSADAADVGGGIQAPRILRGLGKLTTDRASRPHIRKLQRELDGIVENPLEYVVGARREAAEFMTKFLASGDHIVDPVRKAKFDSYFASAEAHKEIAELVRDVIELAAITTSLGHPGHDRRHCLIKDPLAGLRLTMTDGLEGYERMHLISGMLHDIGRIAETRFNFTDQSGVTANDHAYVSFVVAKTLLAQSTDMPRDLKAHLLYAIAAHQAGKPVEGANMTLLNYTQAADRVGLVGCEAIVRYLTYDLHATNRGAMRLETARDEARKTVLPSPGGSEDLDVVHHAEFYARNLFKNRVVSESLRHIEGLKIDSYVALWLMAQDQETRAQIFAPEMGVNAPDAVLNYKGRMPAAMWDEVCRVGQTFEQTVAPEALPVDRAQLVQSFLRTVSPSLALVPGERSPAWDIIRPRVINLTDAAARSVAIACKFIDQRLQAEDMEQVGLLATAKDRYGQDSLEGLVAQLVDEQTHALESMTGEALSDANSANLS